MEKIVHYGEILEIKKGIVFGNPSHEASPPHLYRKDFQDINWIVNLESEPDNDCFVNFILAVGRRTLLGGLTWVESKPNTGEFTLSYPARFQCEESELRFNSYFDFIGSQETLEAKSGRKYYFPALKGTFGKLLTFTCTGEKKPAGFLLLASVPLTSLWWDDLHQMLISSFNGEEIDHARYSALTNPEDLSFRFQAYLELEHAKTEKQHSELNIPHNNKSHLQMHLATRIDETPPGNIPSQTHQN